MTLYDPRFHKALRRRHRLRARFRSRPGSKRRWDEMDTRSARQRRQERTAARAAARPDSDELPARTEVLLEGGPPA